VAAWLFVCAALLSAFGSIGSAQAQLRALPSVDERALETAQSRLMRSPRDIGALRDALQAAMRLGEVEMAATYAARAQQLAPGDPLVIAARGAIEVNRGRPQEGLLLFAEADAAGAKAEQFVADRALGYDLIGDQPSAQYYYAIGARLAPDDEITRRYALSLAIIGNYVAGEEMLRPLLKAQDRGAWRTYAFMLAIAGRQAEARKVLTSTLPNELAEQLAPYMQSLPILSRAQQAAAANLGIFPKIQGYTSPEPVTGTAQTSNRKKRRRPGDDDGGR